MKWNFDEWNKKHGHNSLPSYAFIHCLTELEQRTGQKICENIASDSRNSANPGEYDVKFSVNGVELDFTDVFTAYEQQMDRMIRNEAEKLLDEKFTGLIDAINEIQSDGVRKIREKLDLPVMTPVYRDPESSGVKQ